jgi:hypothetical protein
MEMVENADKLRTRNADTTILLLVLLVSMAVEGSAIAICNNTSILKNPLLLEFY